MKSTMGKRGLVAEGDEERSTKDAMQRRKTMKKRIVSVMLAFTMVLSMLVGVTPTVYATEATLGNPVRNEEEGIMEWDSIYFGNYYQTEYSPQKEPEHPVDGQVYTDTDGTKYICKTDLAYYKYEDIKWRVLYEEDDLAFLMADRLLVMKEYDEIYKEDGTSWEECTLRTWLNDTFYDAAFTEEEKGAIIESTVANEANPEYGTSSGNDTEDKVYIPSLSEMTNADYGFLSDTFGCAGRDCELSDYAKTVYYSDWFKDDMTNMYFLRTAGVDEYDVVYVYEGGNVVNAGGGRASGFVLGVCPVINMDIAGYEGWSNAGTYSSTGEYTEAGNKTTVDNPTSVYDEETNMTTTTWDCINFGKYYQSLYEPQNEPENPVDGQVYTDTDGTQYLCKTSGTKFYKYESIKWRVLSVSEDKAFVIADQILDMRVFNEPVNEYEDETSWEECTLRTWLNDTFYNNAFTEEEQGAILETIVENTENFEQGTISGNNTIDKIYLLSMDEAVNTSYGFSGSMWDEGLLRENTAYSKSLWKHDWEESGSSPWFLRTRGCYEDDVAYIYYDSITSGSGGRASGYVYGICPVLNIDLSNEDVWNYAGKIESGSLEEDDEDYEYYEGYEYVLINDGTEVEITGYIGTATQLVIPSVIDGKSVTYIGESAFEGCTGLTNITIPESVTSIEWSAFAGCIGLTDITIPKSVISIGYSAFEGCTGLKDVYIYNSKAVIEQYALGESAVIHGYKNSTAQKYAEEKGMTFKALDGDEHAFSSEWTIDVEATCSKPGSKSHHCTRENCTEKTDVTEIPATGQHTYDSGVVTKEATCTEKGQKVYTCTVCKGTKTETVAATGIHLYGDWEITKEAMCDKKGTKVQTCTSCGHMVNETIPATGFVKGGMFNQSNNTYTIKTVKGKKGTVVYEGPTKNNQKTVKIPKTVKIKGKTYTVTEIGDKAFKGKTKLKSVTIPEGVTKIGKEAFSGCKNLKTITIKSTKLKSVGKNAIKNIDKKASIKVPKKQYSKYKKLFKSSTGYKKTMKIKK